MALAPTLYDFEVALSHVDRSLDVALSLKVARHPSETLDRVWLRVLTYCWLYEERIAFGPGIGEPDAPDILTLDYSGQTTLWVRVGKADPIKVQRAVDQNSQARVAVVFGDAEKLEAFIAEATEQGAHRLSKAELAAIDSTLITELAKVESRRTKIALTIVGDHFYVDRGGTSVDGPITRGAVAAK